MPDTRRTLSALQTLYADNTAGDISAQDLRDGVQSVHQEKVCQTAAFASEPATDPLAGDLFLPSDSFYAERYSGSAWVPWGPIFPMTKPVDGDFAWINQDSATVTTTKGGIHLARASQGGNDYLHIRKKSAPATPYTITAAFMHCSDLGGGTLPAGNKYSQCGLCWRQSSDGKVIIFAVSQASTDTAGGDRLKLALSKYSSATAFSANYGTPRFYIPLAPIVFFRLEDDGTNRKIHWSADGQNFSLLHSVGRTDFMTADEVGFFVGSYDQQSAITLLSWKEA